MSRFSHSRIVQKDIWDTTNDVVQNAFKRTGDEIPLVLIPPSVCCYNLMTTVPAGHHVLWEKFNAYFEDTGGAGTRMCMAPYDRISFIVCASTITYNAPAHAVPTADNILVDLDCVVTFRIPDVPSAHDLVYKLGASRLNAILSAECEEGIRNLVYSVNHHEVLDLAAASEKTGHIKSQLISKLSPYGVSVSDIVIRKCLLPADLQARLERTTTMVSEIEDAKKRNENEKRNIEYAGEQQQLDLDKDNNRRVQALSREIERFEIESEEKMATAHAEVEVAVTEAKSNAEVQLIKCAADEKLAEVEGQRYKSESVRSTRTECDKKLTVARQEAESMKSEADAQLEVAQSEADTIIARARAEDVASLKLAEKRRYELEWARLKIMEDIAGQGRKVIMGDHADRLMDDLCPAPAAMSR